MKRITKSVLGVTLLEIMLVLAIASMIIVMSVRYYQSATSSQQSTAAVNQVLAIATAMDSLSMSAGTYSSVGATATAAGSAIKAYLGSTALTSPTGQAIAFTAVGPSSYGISMPLTPSVCTNVAAQLKGNVKITMTATPCSAGTLTYTYDKTK